MMTLQEIIDELLEAVQPDFGCDNAEANEALEPFRLAHAKIEALIAAAREEGRQEVRQQVEAAGDWEVLAADIHGAMEVRPTNKDRTY